MAPPPLLRLEDLFAPFDSTTAEEFAEQQGTAFLVHEGELGDHRVAKGPQTTLTIRRMEDAMPTPTPRRRHLVFPVRRGGRSAVERFITVGRTANNDVVIPDVSLSKFHAFFREDEEGRFNLTDARSRNGTSVDNQRVPPQGEGEPVVVASGARVRFGLVTLTFLDVTALRELITSARRPPPA